MEIRKDDEMKRKRIVLLNMILAICICMSYAVIAEDVEQYEQPMYFYFSSNDVGYDSNPGYKIPSIPCAFVSMDEGTIGKTTNYLVAASDGTQITPAYLHTRTGSPYYDYLQPWYYSEAHEGIVYLRANTGGTGAGYYVAGQWAANFRP